MPQDALLKTKLYIPPARPGLVSRPRLLERLNAGLAGEDVFSRALTLISAPAGFGKTTLVSEWVDSLRSAATNEGQTACAVAWLSLGAGDNDSARFWSYVIAALQTIQTRQGVSGEIGKGALSALRSPQPPAAEAVLTDLINEIASTSARIVLILDDYHVIEAQEIHDGLSFLFEHLPPQMHLVIATREDPQLPFARLRSRGRLTELRASELRFSTSEAAEFLNQAMGLDLSQDDIAALEARTEGWIAGLQLAAISMQGHADASSLIKSFTGSHRYVLDYLIEEVLEQQSTSIQTFLLQTSVLDRVTGSLCDAVRLGPGKAPSGRATLELLERTNLFIAPLDEERRWYRYHQLFADLLRQRLRLTHPDWVPELQLRASQWYERNGLAEEAIEYALRAQDYERAARLLEEHADVLWTQSQHAKLRRLLARLPGEVVLRRPFLCVFHAWFLYARGPRDAAEEYLRAAEQMLDPSAVRSPETELPEPEPLSVPSMQRLRGRVAVIRAFMASFQGEVPAIIEYSRQALGYLPKRDLVWRSTAAIALGDALGFQGDMPAAYQARLEAAKASEAAGNAVFTLLAYMKVAITLREQGQLRRTIAVSRKRVQRAGDRGLARGSMVGCLLAIWGEALAELGDLEGALAQARRGVALAESGGDWSLFGWSCLCLIRVLLSAGDTAGALEIVQKLEKAARESLVPPWIANQMGSWQTRLWLAQGRQDAASQWVSERGLVANVDSGSPPDLDFFSLDDQVTLARVLIARERWAEANRLLPRLLQTAEAGGRLSKAIEIQVLQALALESGGDTDHALAALQRALALAEKESFVGVFVDEGPVMAVLLGRAAARGMMPAYVAKLQAAFDTATKDGRRRTREDDLSAVVRPSSLVEPLSARELEVLQLIADGLTNREIASRLFLSLNTVKAHTRNIYGKLGVRSRTQAVARARALGVLPSS